MTSVNERQRKLEKEQRILEAVKTLRSVFEEEGFEFAMVLNYYPKDAPTKFGTVLEEITPARETVRGSWLGSRKMTRFEMVLKPLLERVRELEEEKNSLVKM